MKLPEIFIKENNSIKDAMKIIDNCGLGIVLVVDSTNKLLGLVADSDIRRAVMNGTNIDRNVSTIMNKKPIVVDQQYTKLSIDNLLLDVNKSKFPVYGTLCIPVLNNRGQPVDIIFVSEKGYRGKFSDANLEMKKVTRVLVVGGAGYLGGILSRKLLANGYKVRILDNLMYGDEALKDLYKEPNFEFVKGDMRDIRTVVKSIKDVDAVIHLAAIVGDPASALDPGETIEINYLSSMLLAEICRLSQINRFIFASTCSVYGASETGKMLNETSKLNPVSLYAEMKLKSEKGILSLEDDNFSPVIFRMGTLFGLAPRMRFDLVVNVLTAKAMKEKSFSIFGGTQWRAFCHVEDAAQAYIDCLEAPIQKIKGEIFNVAPINATILDIGKAVKVHVPTANMVIEATKTDERDYCVSDEKIRKKIGYKGSHAIEDGITSIVNAFKEGKYKDYTASKYYNHTYLHESRMTSDEPI